MKSLLLYFVVIELKVFCFESTYNKPFFSSSSLSVLCHKSGVNENKILKSVSYGIGACPLPISKLREGRYEGAVVGDYYTEPPEWLNVTLATIGQNFLRKNIIGYLYSAALGTILVGTSSDVRRVLLSAGSIMIPEKAARRYLGFILHTLYWANGDIIPSTTTPNMYRWNQSTMFESLNLIRSVHETVSYQADVFQSLYSKPLLSKSFTKLQTNEPLWKAFYKDLVASPLVVLKNQPRFPPQNGGTKHYFNQFGMILQYWANVALPIMNPEASMFISNPSDEELLGYLHFWGFLAHVMGLRPEYNINLQPDLPTAKKYFKDVLEEYLVPNLFYLDYETKVLLEVSTKAFGKTFPFLDEGLFLKQLLEDLLRVEANNLVKAMPHQAKIYASLVKRYRFMTDLPSTNSVVRFVMNGMIQVSTIEKFGFNILKPDNFTNGIIEYDENVLKGINLWQHFRKNSSNKVY